MARTDAQSLLAAEASPAAQELLRCLRPLGARVALATSAEEALRALRREVFRRAVVAIEIALDGEPLLARLSRLSSLECLVAIGPGGDAAAEGAARVAGAQAYLARPVTTGLLSRALGLPWPGRAARPP